MDKDYLLGVMKKLPYSVIVTGSVAMILEGILPDGAVANDIDLFCCDENDFNILKKVFELVDTKKLTTFKETTKGYATSATIEVSLIPVDDWMHLLKQQLTFNGPQIMNANSLVAFYEEIYKATNKKKYADRVNLLKEFINK